MYEDAPEDLIFDKFEAMVYPHHPLGRPVLGVPETVRSFSREQLFDYIDDHYAPNRLVVAVAGNIRHDAIVRQVERLTRELDREPTPIHREPANGYDAGEQVERRPIQQAHLIVGTRSAGMTDPRRTVLTTLNTLLGGGMSSRLSQNIREKYGYCYNIYSYANMLSDTGDFGVYMGTDASKVDRSRKLIGRELDKLAQTPVSARALAQAKNQLKGSLMLGLESMSNRMMRLGRIELTFGRYFSLDEIIASIDAVTAEEVRDLAAELFAPERLSTVAILPEA